MALINTRRLKTVTDLASLEVVFADDDASFLGSDTFTVIGSGIQLPLIEFAVANMAGFDQEVVVDELPAFVCFRLMRFRQLLAPHQWLNL